MPTEKRWGRPDGAGMDAP
uniref:Uncharacterized protein n=1 Tax=Arundo donax TaxID=35708 RepID=A0A0A9EKW9_ARUDO